VQKRTGRPTLRLDDFFHPATSTARIATVNGRRLSSRRLRHIQSFLAPRAFFGLPTHGVAGTGAGVDAGVTLATAGAGGGVGVTAGALAAEAGVTGVRFVESIGFELISSNADAVLAPARASPCIARADTPEIVLTF